MAKNYNSKYALTALLNQLDFQKNFMSIAEDLEDQLKEFLLKSQMSWYYGNNESTLIQMKKIPKNQPSFIYQLIITIMEISLHF